MVIRHTCRLCWKVEYAPVGWLYMQDINASVCPECVRRSDYDPSLFEPKDPLDVWADLLGEEE